MKIENLVRRLENYLEKNFIEPEPLPEGVIILHGAKFSISRHVETKPDKYDGVIGAMRWQLDKIFDRLELEGTFGQRIRDLIAKKGLTEVEVYKRAQLDRRIFSKIHRYRNYTPSERTIWAIGLALELSLDEALEILGDAGYTFSKYDKQVPTLLTYCDSPNCRDAGYTFSKYDKQDLIIKFCFENKVYDIFTVNELLVHYGFKPLGDSIF